MNYIDTAVATEAVPSWDLADRLRKSMREAGIGASEMADHLGLSRNTVGNYINGRREPDHRTLVLWAMRTGVPVGWLRDGIGASVA